MFFSVLLMGLAGPFLAVWIWRQALVRLQTKSTCEHAKSNTAIEDDDELDDIVKKLSPLASVARKKHGMAKEAQRQYQDLISCAIGMVFFAFLIFACEVSFASQDPRVPKLAYSLELVLLVSSIFVFFSARSRLSGWMRTRTEAEILRQRYYCALSSGSLEGTKLDSSSIDRWLKNVTTDTSGTELKPAEFAISSMEDNIELALREGGTRKTNVKKLYLDKRVSRQIVWFKNAERRQARFIHIRERVLLTFFGLAIFAALLKAAHYMFGVVPLYKELEPLLTLISMFSLAATALLAALLLSQNSGYLRLRYKKQANWIDREFNAVSPKTLSVDMVVAFETAMSKELKDFLEIFDANSPEISL